MYTYTLQCFLHNISQMWYGKDKHIHSEIWGSHGDKNENHHLLGWCIL